MSGVEVVGAAAVHAVAQVLPLLPLAIVVFVVVMRALVRGGALEDER